MEKIQKTPYILFTALIFLLPLFFLPLSQISFGYDKIILLSVAVFISLLSWVVVSFKTGRLTLPLNWLSLSIVLIPVVFFLSAFFSQNKQLSLIGNGLDIGSASFILLMALLMFLISVFVRSKEKIFYCYLCFGAGFLVVAVYQILHLVFGANFLSFNYFTDVTSTPVGRWNDLAVFSGVAVLLSLMSLELLSLSRAFKILFYVVMVIGLFLLGLVNFAVLWNTPITIFTLIGLFALIFFVYSFSSAKAEETKTPAAMFEDTKAFTPTALGSTRRIPLPSLIVLICAVVFTLAARPLSSRLDSLFNISVLDVSPTWQSTFIVAKSALSHNVALGSGPSRFLTEWLLSKPDSVNQTDFWNTDFNFGVGIIPTFLITTGILGILSWLFFFVLLVYLGIKTLFSKVKDQFSLYLIISSFFVSIFLWIMNILYVPGTVIFALAFIFTGLFLGSLFREGILKERTFSYIEDSRKGFIVILLLIVIMIGVITWGYLLGNKITASAYANESVIALNGGEISEAQDNIVKAINTDKEPEYYRLLSQIEIAQMSTLLQSGSADPTALKTNFQNLLDNAVSVASAAIALDQSDYQNWLSLASVYGGVSALGAQNSLAQAENAYQEALKRNPKNPGIYLNLAQLEATNKNYDKAKEYLTDALKMKNDYLNAIYLLAQIQLTTGDSSAAINSMQAAAAIAPNNPTVFYQLGLLEYDLNNWSTAAAAFEKSLSLVPSYADARYSLGLTYYKLGRTSDAESQFEQLLSSNPQNTLISAIIANLKAGRDPLYSSSAATSSNSQSATSSKSGL